MICPPSHSITSSARPSSDERDGEAERLRGLEVDDEFDFRGLLHRQVRWLFALENAAGVSTPASRLASPRLAAVAHESAGRGDNGALMVDRRNAVARPPAP